jgi:uncharacterized protein (DUF1778 family)
MSSPLKHSGSPPTEFILDSACQAAEQTLLDQMNNNACSFLKDARRLLAKV